MVNGYQIIWTQALPEDTSTQKAELIALTKALKLGKRKRLNIYTDSRYAFAIPPVHGSIYQQRGLLTLGGKEIKNKEQILALLRPLYDPAKVSIIHCPSHQKSHTVIAGATTWQTERHEQLQSWPCWCS
jgi:ribonuclease HI